MADVAPAANPQTAAWIILVIAGLFEIGWAIGLKYTDGFTKFWPTVGVAASLAISMWLLAQACRTLPIGTAYSVWVGIGSVGTVILGVWLLGETASFWRICSAALVVAGIVGLKLSAGK